MVGSGKREKQTTVAPLEREEKKKNSILTVLSLSSHSVGGEEKGRD